MVEDRRRRARLTQHRLLALRRDSAVPDDLQLALQVRLVHGLLRQSRQGLGKQVFQDLRRRKCQDRLAQRAGVQRKLQAHLEHAERGVRPEHVVDDDDACPMHHADPHRGPSPRGEMVGVGDRSRAQLVEVEV